MQRKICLLGLLVILFLGTSIGLGGDSGLCPLHSGENMIIPDPPQDEVLTAGENLAGKRSQVLLEGFGRTT